MAGVDGAKPGIFMPAHPRVGQTGRQEFYKGHAEDHFKVLALFGTVAAPGRRTPCSSQETTPLEPGVVDHKLYVRGIGTVLEQTERGGDERNELVALTRGSGATQLCLSTEYQTRSATSRRSSLVRESRR